MQGREIAKGKVGVMVRRTDCSQHQAVSRPEIRAVALRLGPCSAPHRRRPGPYYGGPGPIMEARVVVPNGPMTTTAIGSAPLFTELCSHEDSHPGSFEGAHRLRDGSPLPPAAPDAEERYDPVVVGGATSFLSAAEPSSSTGGRGRSTVRGHTVSAGG
jgi:hypothetical protein